MWILRWEFFVVTGLWGLAAALFKAAGAKGSAKGLPVAGGIVLLLAGVALLVVRLGL